MAMEDWGRRISAVFQPTRTDDLVPGAAEHIGQRITLEYFGQMEDGTNQWGVERGQLPEHIIWMTEADLQDVTEL
jgi:hypothetical protein